MLGNNILFFFQLERWEQTNDQPAWILQERRSVHFFFHSRLRSLKKWCRLLFYDHSFLWNFWFCLPQNAKLFTVDIKEQIKHQVSMKYIYFFQNNQWKCFSERFDSSSKSYRIRIWRVEWQKYLRLHTIDAVDVIYSWSSTSSSTLTVARIHLKKHRTDRNITLSLKSVRLL